MSATKLPTFDTLETCTERFCELRLRHAELSTDRGITPIQVTVGEPQARHEDALDEFYKKFPHANEALFVTPDSFEQIDRVN